MTDKPSLDTILRWISHYAEDTATLHKYESERYRDAERAARWRQTVDRRRDEVETALRELVACDPGLHMRIADTIQRELYDSTDGYPGLGEQIAHTLCAEISEIGQAVR